MADAKFDNISCDSITIGSGGNKVMISASDSGTGIWLQNAGSANLVSIYNLDGQIALGIGDPTGGYPIALSVDKDGPMIQVVVDGRVVIVRGEHLANIAINEK